MNLPQNVRVMQQANNYVSQATVKELRVRPFFEDAIVFAKVGAAISHERKRIAPSPFLIDNNMMAFTPKQKEDLEFIYHLFQRIKLSKYSQIGALPSYNASDILDIRTFYPTSKSERNKIVTILNLVSNRIEKQAEMITNLKKYKRGVMRAIFRDKAILFSETTKWKSVRLGDECTFFSGGTPKSTDSSFYGGAIPFIRSGEIHSDKTELFLTDDGLKYSSAKMVSKGDLIIALYGATSGEVDISKIDGAINQAILCIRPSWINKVYLKYLLEDKKNDILNTYLQGGQGNLSAEIIKNLIFDIPDECSQLVVVDFLNTMDRRINSSIRLMENLITLRFGLMQQLFI